MSFITESKRYFYKTRDGDQRLRLYSSSRQFVPTMVIIPTDAGSIKTANSFRAVVTRPGKLKKIFGSLELFDFPPELRDVVSKIQQGIIDAEVINDIRSFPKLMNYLEFKNFESLFKFMTTDMQMGESLFNKFFGRVPELTDTESLGVTTFHNARVFYPETASKRTRESMSIILESIYKAFEKYKILPLFNGNIRFVPLSGKSIGKYNTNDHSMYIQPSAKPSQSVLYTLFHEYGHKLYYEWMDNELREKVISKFTTLMRSGDTYHPSFDDLTRFEDAREALIQKFERGMKIEYKGKNKAVRQASPYTLTSVKERDGNFIFYFVSSDDKNRELRLNSRQLMHRAIKLPFDVPEKNINLAYISHATEEWFPTNYSTTDYSEWFAELFAYLMAGSLKGEVFDWITELVYDAKQDITSETVGSNNGESNDATQHMNLTMNPKQIVPTGNAVSDSDGSTGWDVMDPYHGNQRTGSMNPVE